MKNVIEMPSIVKKCQVLSKNQADVQCKGIERL